jgi:MoxR-like ATPase
MERVIIDGVELNLSAPDELAMSWVGQPELVTQVLAAWLVIGENDLPLNGYPARRSHRDPCHFG